MIWIVRFVIGSISLAAVSIVWQRWLQRQRPPVPDPRSLIIIPDEVIITERTTPDTLTIRWRASEINADDELAVYLSTDPDAIDRTAPTATATGVQAMTIPQRDPAARYYGELVIQEPSPDNTTRTLPLVERVVPMANVPNFRDIGGYETDDGQQVRWNTIYRASSLAYLSPDDRHQLQQMKIALVCDLRTEEEIEEDPDQLPDDIAYLSLPATTSDRRWQQMLRLLFQHDFIATLLPDLYTRVMIDNNPHVFGKLLHQIADADNLPLVIHCTAGKDRTGLAVALLLSLLGVPDDTIIADYTLSNHHVDYFAQAATKVLSQLQLFGIQQDDFLPLLVADAAVMQTTFDHIRSTYGSVEAYLRDAAGVDDDTQARIRQHLLEPRPY